MKHHLLCAFAALLPASLVASDRITVEAKFISVLAHTPASHDVAKLNKMRGVDILSPPRVTTKPGQEVIVEIWRVEPSRNALFKPHGIRIGTTLRVTPIVKDGRLAYRAEIKVRDFAPDGPHKAGQNQIEFTSREMYLSGTLRNGEPVWADFAQQVGGKKLTLWLQFTREGA